MAYHTIGTFRQEEYAVSNHSSSTAAVFAVGNRGVIKSVLCAVKVNQTATAGSWTVLKNGVQITGLSSVAVTTAAVGESSGVSTGVPTVLSEATLARGDIVSVTGSSLTAANWTFTVQEF